jgi:uncharacterized RDD family membrane protein YckC
MGCRFFLAVRAKINNEYICLMKLEWVVYPRFGRTEKKALNFIRYCADPLTMRRVREQRTRQFIATLMDASIELFGGLLGSYFGAMVAALVTAMNQDAGADAMQSSMKSGFGIGFAFWAISISLINRVLIQGISRASIGKKIMKLEIASSGAPLTWNRMALRWVLSVGSLATFGAGYWYAWFNAEGRFFHDVVAGTRVVPEGESEAIAPAAIPAEKLAYLPMVRKSQPLMVIPSPEAEQADKKKAA